MCKTLQTACVREVVTSTHVQGVELRELGKVLQTSVRDPVTARQV